MAKMVTDWMRAGTADEDAPKNPCSGSAHHLRGLNLAALYPRKIRLDEAREIGDRAHRERDRRALPPGRIADESPGRNDEQEHHDDHGNRTSRVDDEPQGRSEEFARAVGVFLEGDQDDPQNSAEYHGKEGGDSDHQESVDRRLEKLLFDR